MFGGEDNLTRMFMANETEFAPSALYERLYNRSAFYMIWPDLEQDVSGGWVFLLCLISLYMFIFLAVVCHDFFVPSLEMIASICRIEQSVAGAALLAGGGAIPQLAIELISELYLHSEIGLATIVGSSLFNSLFVVGVCGAVVHETMKLNWYPVLRDSIGNLAASVILSLALADKLIHWWEGLIMLLAYAFYLGILAYNEELNEIAKRNLQRYRKWRVRTCCDCCLTSNEKKYKAICAKKQEENEMMADESQHQFDSSYCSTDLENEDTTLVNNEKNHKKIDMTDMSEPSLSSNDVPIRDVNKHVLEQIDSIEELATFKQVSMLYPPSGKCMIVLWVIALPAILVANLLIPDFRRPGCWRSLYPLTVIMSIICIALSCFLLLGCITQIGYIYNLSDESMGLTIVAIGSTVPDMFVSVIVVRQGFGEMAICNALGSNIVEILVCLGFPFFLEALIYGEPTLTSSNPYTVILCILVACFIVYLTFQICKWRLKKSQGWFLIIVYIVIIGIMAWIYSNARKLLLASIQLGIN